MTTTRVVRYPPLWKHPDNLQAGFCLKRSNHERQTDFMQIRSTLRTISGIQQISKECTIVLTSEAWRSWLLKGMAMGQETSFVCLTYCLHRYLRCYHEPYIQSNCPAVDPLELKQTINTLLVLGYAVLLLIGWYGEEEGGGIYQKRSHRAKSRTIDAAFKSILLIASSTIIPSILPQFYVYTLAQLCLLVHIFLCDYQYACGDDRPRREPVAAFTSVVLLASQLSNFTSAFVFVTASIIAFSFYPDARHRIAKKASYKKLCSEHDFIGEIKISKVYTSYL